MGQIQFALRQSMHRVSGPFWSLSSPVCWRFFLALIVFSLIGWGLAALVSRILVAHRNSTSGLPRVNLQVRRQQLADWSPSHSPGLLLSRIVVWVCVLIGIAVGLSAFDASYPANSAVAAFLLPYLTHLTGAVLMSFAGGLIARFLSRSVLISAVNAQIQYARFLSLGVKWLVLVLTAAMALDHLHIGGAIVELAFGILFGGIVLTLSLAMGLGSRDLVSRSIERTRATRRRA